MKKNFLSTLLVIIMTAALLVSFAGCSNTAGEESAARIAELETEVKLRDANVYTLGEMNKMRNYVDERFNAINSQLCAQAVHNQKTEDSFVLARQDIAAVESRLNGRIELEAERRCCGDNAIVNYANATFYPKMVADVTVGTTTTAQTLYNPIPDCGCCGK